MKKYKFTLLELMIVVAILGILVSILLPSLSNAKEASKRAVCMSNMKQIGIGAVLHLKDNDGKYPKRDDWKDFQFSWFGQKGNRESGFYTRHPKARSLNTYILGIDKEDIPEDIKIPLAQCPSDTFHYEDKGASYNNNTFGKAGLENIKPTSRIIPGEFKRNGDPKTESVGVNISKIENPSMFVTFSEYGGDKSALSEPENALDPNMFFHTPQGRYYWNVLFADGTVNFVRIVPSLKIGENYSYDRRLNPEE